MGYTISNSGVTYKTPDEKIDLSWLDNSNVEEFIDENGVVNYRLLKINSICISEDLKYYEYSSKCKGKFNFDTKLKAYFIKKLSEIGYSNENNRIYEFYKYGWEIKKYDLSNYRVKTILKITNEDPDTDCFDTMDIGIVYNTLKSLGLIKFGKLRKEFFFISEILNQSVF